MNKFLTALKETKWLDVLMLLFVLTLADSSIAAPTASFSASGSGTNNNLTITVAADIADADVGKNGNYYVGFSYNNAWYFNNGTTWVSYNGGALPVYVTRALASGTAQVARNVNLSSMIGGKLYVGYGLTESDMRANSRFAMVYMVTATGTAKGPAPVLLGTTSNFAILAKTAVSTVPPSAVTGNIGVSPAATSFLTGFSLTMVGTLSATSPQVTGSLYGADMSPPTSTNLTTAVSDMETAYTDAAGRPTPDFLNLGSGNLGGLTLAAGLYKWGTSVTIPTDITITGGADDVWIFQMSGDLNISSGKKITLAGGAQARNIFWQVAGEVVIQSGVTFEGNILSQSAIILQTGAVLNGRALAQTRVTLDKAVVVKPAL